MDVKIDLDVLKGIRECMQDYYDLVSGGGFSSDPRLSKIFDYKEYCDDYIKLGEHDNA